LGCLACYLTGCNSFFYFPTHENYASPERLGITYTDHYFATPSGIRLHGQVLNHRSDTPYRGLFVLFHGNAQNLTSHWLELAWVLNRGYDLFIFDYPGYGKSQGEADRRGTVEAGAAALRLVSDSLRTPEGALVLVGSSLGGAILMRCFPEWQGRSAADLVIAESTFPSYREVARSSLAKHWITWPLQPLTYLLISETESPRKWIPLITPTPFLATACQEDAVVSSRFAEEIYGSAGPPKWHWAWEACGHIQSFRSKLAQDRLMGLVDSLYLSHEANHAH